MNRAYRVIWNAALGLFQVVSELAKSHSGKSKSRVEPHTLKTRLKPAALAVAAALAMPALFATHNAQAQVVVTGGNSGTDYTLDGNTPPNLTIVGGISYVGNDNATLGTITNNGSITGNNLGISDNGPTSGASIDTLINHGVIAGTGNPTGTGIRLYYATLGTLMNTGTISGDMAGIYGGAVEINTLDNSGLISSGLYGISNNFGTISALTNEAGGVISGDYGIVNADTMETLTNHGKITGASTAVYNSGILGTLTNTGDISGGTLGFANLGIVNVLSNAGTISGDAYGILNPGSALVHSTINTLTNESGGTIIGGTYGIENRGGTIGALLNAGFINSVDNTGLIGTGNTGIFNSGSIGTLTNAGKLMARIMNDGGTIDEIDNDNNGSIIATTAIFNYLGEIGTLNNAGLISGNIFGIENSDSIGTLTNTGTIAGSIYGIYSDGNINTLINSDGGFIGGTVDGIAIGTGGEVGKVTAISNAGTINGGSSGIANDGSIATLNNAGLINGNFAGVWSDNTITTLTNENGGTISGGNVGVMNYNVVGALTNDGLISGGNSFGIINYGSIGTLTNNASGIISSNNEAIQNDGIITALTNAGLINGPVWNWGGTIVTLTNDNGGTITRGVFNSVNTGTGAAASIGALINSGTILGSFFSIGVFNDSNLGTLTNSGVISGNSYGIRNGWSSVDFFFPGTLGTLTNSGTISGGNIGIYNDAGTIDTLTNESSGTISGSVNAGIDNVDVINVLTNHGVITGNAGILNSNGTIATITNAGTISGASEGIYNLSGGAISTLTHESSGVISGNFTGIWNSGGTIDTITNAGTINNVAVGIYNDSNGTISAFSNSGVITGISYAIDNGGGTIGVITNSGLIAGNIGSSNALTINGGTMQGILTGYGDTTGQGAIGSISITGGNLTFDSGNLLLNDSITILGSATRMVNNTGAVLEVDQPLTITGNYTQSATATLQIGVLSNATTTGALSDVGYGRLVVTGDTTIESGSNVVILSKGYALAAGQRYTIIDTQGTASYDGGITLLAHGSAAGGAVTTLNYTATGFTATGEDVTDAGTNDHVLVVSLTTSATNSGGNTGGNTDTGGSTSTSGSTSGNNSTSGSTISGSGLPSNISVLTALTNLPVNVTDAGINDLRNAMLAELDSGNAGIAGALSNQLAPTQMTNPDQFFASSEGALKALVGHLNAGSDDTASGVSSGDGMTQQDLWVEGYGGHMNQAARDGFDDYTGDYGGFLLGTDKTVAQTSLGAAFDYSHSTVRDQDLVGDKLNIDNYGVLGYGTYQADNPHAPWYVHGVVGVVWQSVSSNRVVNVASVTDALHGSFDGQQYLAHLDAGYPLAVGKGVVATPIIGVTGVHLHNGSYTESGDNGAALKVNNSNANSFRSNLGVNVAKSWRTDFGTLTPNASAQWVHEYIASATNVNASFAADSTGSTAFVVQGQSPIKNFADLGVGATLVKSDTLSFTARYELQHGSGYTSNTVSVKGMYKF